MIVNINLQCQALDQDGRMCRNESCNSVNYHGDSEIYHDRIGWMKVNLCKEHYALIIAQTGVDEVKDERN